MPDYVNFNQNIFLSAFNILFSAFLRSSIIGVVLLLVAGRNVYFLVIYTTIYIAFLISVILDLKLKTLPIGDRLKFRKSIVDGFNESGWVLKKNTMDIFIAENTAGRVLISDTVYMLIGKDTVKVSTVVELPWPFSYIVAKNLNKELDSFARRS